MTANSTAIQQAILDTLKEANRPLKCPEIISKVYEKTRRLTMHYQLNWLIGSGKIERVGMGLYQIAKK